MCLRLRLDFSPRIVLLLLELNHQASALILNLDRIINAASHILTQETLDGKAYSILTVSVINEDKEWVSRQRQLQIRILILEIVTRINNDEIALVRQSVQSSQVSLDELIILESS